jgi:Fanconi-associated nuclease 1
MVLRPQKDTIHDAMLGRRISHPASTNFDDNDFSPPPKRLKTQESTDADSRDVSDDEASIRTPASYQDRDDIPDSEYEGNFGGGNPSASSEPMGLESALPFVKTDKEAIQEYEAMRAADDVPGDLSTRLNKRNWEKGKSSIYVDAFNLALETVLSDEEHLFDEKEMEVFNQWRALEYEAQYL